MNIDYIKNKIENCNLSSEVEVDSAIKRLLLDISSQLYQRQEDLYDILQENTFNKLSNLSISKDLFVYTALVPKKCENDYSHIGFVPMLTENDDTYFETNVFLNTSYDEIISLCNKTFMATITEKNGVSYDVEYSFFFNNELVKKEDIIYKISQVYNIDKSIVYSPFARKFVTVNFKKAFPEDCAIDFNVKENNLEGIMLQDYSLIWNISIENSSMFNIEKREKPLNDDILYTYKCSAIKSLDEYILPKQYIYSDTYDNISILDIKEINQDENGSSITITKDISEENDFEIISCRKPTQNDLIEFTKKNIPVFYHNIKPRVLNKYRVRTFADVNYVLSQFELSNVKIYFDNSNLTDNKINRYSKDLKYYNSVKDFLKMNSSKILNIKFSGDYEYLTDYANYVLSYLEIMYPEFRWAGVLE